MGVKPEYFDPVGRALLHAMKVATAEEDWTPEVEDAWTRLYAHTSVVLLLEQQKANSREESRRVSKVHPIKTMTVQHRQWGNGRFFSWFK